MKVLYENRTIVPQELDDGIYLVKDAFVHESWRVPAVNPREISEAVKDFRWPVVVGPLEYLDNFGAK